MPAPPMPEVAGNKAPTSRELGLSEEIVVAELRKREGLPPLPDTPCGEWPLHLKQTTMANLTAIKEMETATLDSKNFLLDALRFLDPMYYAGMRTSRTIKQCRLGIADIEACVANGKFAPCPELAGLDTLPHGYHGVNVFTRPEAKRRRRVITEPHINGTMAKAELPTLQYPDRLTRRIDVADCRYLLQLDFRAYYDSIGISEALGQKFVFRRAGRYWRLRTVPTGARWSVSVAQAITWVLIDVDTPIVIRTMIDNVLIGAKDGQEAEFIKVTRLLLKRFARANLSTDPAGEDIAKLRDEEILRLAEGEVTFLGETFLPAQKMTPSAKTLTRKVQNSIKTVVKMELTLRLRTYEATCRTFVAAVSLLLYAAHTIGYNPAELFSLLRAYRGVYVHVTRNGGAWDAPLPWLSDSTRRALIHMSEILIENRPVWPQRDNGASYDEAAYDDVIFVDASCFGWGAIHRNNEGTTAYQRRWQNELATTAPLTVELPSSTLTPSDPATPFTARHSAHAEPQAALEILQYLQHNNMLGTRIAVVTDHAAIVWAQRKRNGFGGIGRGRALNDLFKWANPRNVKFFYIAGPVNPADTLSRNFGVGSTNEIVKCCYTSSLPPLKQTYSPIAEETRKEIRWMR